MSDALSIARRAVEIVGDRAEAEAWVVLRRDALTRFANSFIHQNVAEDGASVRLRVATEGRVAALTGNLTSDAALERLADGALDAATLQPVDEEWPGLAEPHAVPDAAGADAATKEVEPGLRASIVRDFIDAGDGLLAAGYCDTSYLRVGFANSAGHEGQGETSRATIDGIHQTDESAGSAHQTSRSITDLNGAEAGALAADRARRGVEAVDLEPGDYEVVLAPECAATMVVFLTFYGFSGKAVEEESSFVRLGEQQFDAAITLRDDPLSRDALGLGFDIEGTGKAGLDLIRDGVTSGVAHDRRTAAKAGTVSTGHGHEGSTVWGPMAGDLALDGGTGRVDDMIAGVERGLYVATFNYCRVLDPKSQVVTGLTRNGTFLIEDGAITRAVSNLRFTQSFVAALAPGNVIAVGDDMRFADSEFGAGFVRAPSLRLARWHFTGGAEG